MTLGQKTIFVSDLHLQGLNDPKMAHFLTFLDEMSDSMCRLVIGGDLFDFWVGQNKFIQKQYQPVLEKFLALKKKGIQIDYVEGNHDFHLGDYFRNVLKVNVIEDETYIQVGAACVFLAHGDQVNPHDYGYIFLRWFLRTWFIKGLIRILPDKWVWYISQRSSHVSRTYRAAAAEAVEMFRDYAKGKLKDPKIDVVVLGHTHHPDSQIFDAQSRAKYYFNTGDWITHNSYLEHDSGKFTLKKFALYSQP
jgi:UDP-2,3-diacylglucosamine hydrolase